MVTVDEKFPSININGKKIFPVDIRLSPKTLGLLKRRYGINDENEVTKKFKRKIVDGKFLGGYNLARYNQVGHLIEVEDGFYAILDMRTNTVFYLSTNKSEFKELVSINKTKFIVDEQEYDASEIELSNHFINQASERFRVGIESVRDLFLDVIVNGRYVCITHSKEDRNPAHLFAKDSRLIYVSLDFKVAITSYSVSISNQSFLPEAKKVVVSALFKKIRALEREEKKVTKKVIEESLLLDLRIAEINLELYKTKSENKKEELQVELDSIKSRKEEIYKLWESVIDRVRQHSVLLASFL